MLVFISELPRECQGGVEEFFHSPCTDELNTFPAIRLSRRSGGVKSQLKIHSKRAGKVTLCALLVCSVFLSSCVSRSLSAPDPL